MKKEVPSGVNSDEVWKRISQMGGMDQKDLTRQANIVTGLVNLAISHGLSPEDASYLFQNLKDVDASTLAHGISGIPDSQTVRDLGARLSEEYSSE